MEFIILSSSSNQLPGYIKIAPSRIPAKPSLTMKCHIPVKTNGTPQFINLATNISVA